MRGVYEIVSLSTTREDISFTLQRYTGLNTRHKLLMRYIIFMMCVIWLFGNAAGDKQPRKQKIRLSKTSIYFSLSYIINVYDRYQ